MKTWSELDRFQKSVVKMLFETSAKGEATLDVITQNGAYMGLSAALKTAEQISQADVRKPVLVRCCAKYGMYNSLGEFGFGGNGYGERIRNLFKKYAHLGAVSLVIDHAGEMHPDRWAHIFRCADECAYKLDIAVHVVILLDWRHRNDRKKGAVAQIPPRNNSMHPRQRTWEAGRRGSEKYFSFLKPAQKFEADEVSTPLLEEFNNDAVRSVRSA